jgi:hypothetical protein
MSRTLCMLALAAAVVWPAVAAPQSAPVFNMVGTWKGLNQGLVDGVATHHPADATSRPAGKYKIRRQNFTYVFAEQEGPLFWGTMSSDTVKDIRMLGSLSIDGKTIYMVSQEGHLDGTIIDPDTIEMCYRHANAQSAVIGCNVMKRQK